MVFLIPWRQIFIRTFLVSDLNWGFSLLILYSKLENSFYQIFALSANLQYLLFAFDLGFHQFFDKLFQKRNLCFPLLFDGKELQILRFFVLPNEIFLTILSWFIIDWVPKRYHDRRVIQEIGQLFYSLIWIVASNHQNFYLTHIVLLDEFLVYLYQILLHSYSFKY